MNKSRIRAAAGLAAVALAAAACGNPTATKAAAGTSPINVIVPDAGNFTSGMPVYVGLAQKFFARQHLSVTVVNTTGGATNVAAVLAGKGAIGVDTGPVSVIAADLHGADLKILGADTTGMDILFFAKAPGPVTSIRDLSGKKVGYSSPGSSSEVALDQVDAVLKADGLPPAQGVPIGGPPQEYTAVETGQVAAGFTAAPNLFSQVDSGGIRLLTSVASYPAYKDVAVRVIFGSASFVRAHPAEVRGFLTAWHQAWAWAFAHHAAAMADWQRGARLTEPPSVLATGFRYYTSATQRLLPIDGLQRDVADAVQLGVLKAPMTTSQIADDVWTTYASGAAGG
jgi:NitT/TauT family transport system substrate-binding protein